MVPAWTGDQPDHLTSFPNGVGATDPGLPGYSLCTDPEKQNLVDRVKALEKLNQALEAKISLLETTLAQRNGNK
jgi:hypothetical protein